MPTFQELVKITRIKGGKRRRSNPVTKKLAEFQALQDMEEEKLNTKVLEDAKE